MGIGVATLILQTFQDQINSTTVALVFLLFVLTAATFFGRNPAIAASVAAMLSFNYFFIPPIHTWTISDPQNLIAWAAFTITAIIAGELSAYARRRARESERLFNELQTAFEASAQAEAAKRSEKLKSALLDAVTHDLRTPLTSIKAAVTTLLDSEGGHRTIELDGGGRSEFLNIINEETDRLNGFIQSMVELARIEAGSAGERPALSHVEEIISIALERAEPALVGHHVVVNIQKDLPLISVDARAIAEVVYNLVENGAKYSPAGTTITLTASSRAGRVMIAIADEGEGIPPEKREQVFEKFVRLEGAASTGLGLGLAIARGIVEAQNGTIEIRSPKNGVGTEVILSFEPGED